LFVVTILLFAGQPQVQGQAGWEVVRTLQIGGLGEWDYLTVDADTHRLFVPRTTHTMVIDAETGKTITDIPARKTLMVQL
jgi:hypothetical protein